MARPCIELNLENATLEEVRVAMDCTPTKKGFRRLQALRWLYEGKSREEVAALSCFSLRQVLRFIYAFNLVGLDGLIPRRSSGRRRILPKAQVSEKILPLIEDPSLAGQSHWTAVKLHGWIKANLQTQLGYSTTVRYLHEHDYRLKVPRPWPLNQDEDQRQAFCEKLQNWVADPSADLWFSDESGFEGDPRPRRTWTKIGQGRHSPEWQGGSRDSQWLLAAVPGLRRSVLCLNGEAPFRRGKYPFQRGNVLCQRSAGT